MSGVAPPLEGVRQHEGVHDNAPLLPPETAAPGCDRAGGQDQAPVTPPRFGQLLKRYREGLRLTQRVVADLLGVDTSTIARVESGTRKPPRDAAFYERLRDVPGLDEQHVQALLATPDAPRLVVPDEQEDTGPARPLPRVEIASVGGVQIALELRGDTSEFTEDELERVLRSARETTEVLLDRLAERSARAAAHAARPTRLTTRSRHSSDLDQLAAQSGPEVVQHLKAGTSRA